MYSEWIRRHRRNIGIPVVIAAALLVHFRREYLWISIAFVLTGELIRIWAAGHLRKEQVLTTGGPYRWIRNPLYLGSFLIAIGFCLIAGSVWIWILAVGYFLLCYVPVIRYEESILHEKFAPDFAAYVSVVPAFYPTVKPYSPATTNFSWRQVVKNKEYNAVLGIVVAYAYLLLLSK